MLDLTRPVQLRHGSKARILCTDCKRKCGPLVVLITSGITEYAEYYNLDGCIRSDKSQSPNDLVNAPKKHKRTVWLNVYSESVMAHLSEHSANMGAAPNRITCISTEIEYEV